MEGPLPAVKLRKSHIPGLWWVGDTSLAIRREARDSWQITDFSIRTAEARWWRDHQQEIRNLQFPTRRAALAYLQAFTAINPIEVSRSSGTILCNRAGSRAVRAPSGKVIELCRIREGWFLSEETPRPTRIFASLPAACTWAGLAHPVEGET